jgi:hypothetical protein
MFIREFLGTWVRPVVVTGHTPTYLIAREQCALSKTWKRAPARVVGTGSKDSSQNRSIPTMRASGIMGPHEEAQPNC